MRNSAPIHVQHGTSMIEVLVTIVILAFGLLGLAGVQSRLQLSEMESYQRAQGLLLLDDMANRIASNRTAAASYVTTSPVGTGVVCTTAYAGTDTVKADQREWCNALQGAGETQGGATNRVGGFIGGRGCVASLGSGEYMVTVAWQGMGPISAPPAGVTCGQNNYNGGTGSVCLNDLCRRVLTTIVRIGTL